MYRHHPALNGSALQADIDKTPEARPAYIEDLLLESSVNMIASAPGQGKSCLLLTQIAQGSMGLPVYGELRCPKPLKCYVLCPERPAKELKERLRKIQRTFPCVMDNITFDDGMTGLVDIENPMSRDAIYRSIEGVGGCDVFYIEGLYGMTRKPLAAEETANSILRFHAELMTKFRCSVWISHHTKKVQRNYKGEELPSEWFGSQFLMANVTAAYLFERLPMANKSHLKMGKDTVSGLADQLFFHFDPETFTMSVEPTSPHIAAREKFRAYVNACLREGKTFTYDNLAGLGKVSHNTVWRSITEWVKNGKVMNVSTAGKKGLYKVLDLV